MPTTWDDVLGLVLDLVRALRGAGEAELAGALLAAMTSGCSAPEITLQLRHEALALPDSLADGPALARAALLAGLAAYQEGR